MNALVPRELLTVLVDVGADSVTATFDLGDAYELDVAPDYFSYGFATVEHDGTPVKRFGVKFGPDKTTAHIYDMTNNTQANYDAPTSPTAAPRSWSTSATPPWTPRQLQP